MAVLVPCQARAYKCWFASLGVPTASNDLLEDCTSGLPLLRIMDKLWPGCVDWAKVNARPRNVHERVENCNLALEIAKKMGMKVIYIYIYRESAHAVPAQSVSQSLPHS